MEQVAAQSEKLPASPPRAVIIDDYYARPNPADLRERINTLREFITDNPETGVKPWLDQVFSLRGDHRQLDYFDPLLNDKALSLTFWKRRDESPVGNRISLEVFPDLVAELRPAHESLKNIEAFLSSDGWEVKTYPTLPNVALLPEDLSLIVMDYILVPGGGAGDLRRNTDFLQEYFIRIRRSPDFSCPFVLLISENLDAERNASTFRAAIGLHGPYFRFAKKNELIEGAFGHILTGFKSLQDELESYRRFHEELRSAADSATARLLRSIADLELQDLATLHAGQLMQEGEFLSDYLAWLFGQFLSAEMLRQERLAELAASLPSESYSVLLGQLPATENIQKLFAAISFAMPASAQRHKKENGRLQLRFGDLFVYDSMTAEPRVEQKAAPVMVPAQGELHAATPVESTVELSTPARYLMVISQTCDLFHKNIKNGQVLCLDGEAHPIIQTEVALLRATMRQMDSQGRILLRDGAQFNEVEWRSKELRTIEEKKLSIEEGYRYLGRLNEIYALQVQHSALQLLGRIGVPIQPSYSMFFGKASIGAWNGATEVAGLSASLDRSVVLAVVRNEKAKKSIHRLLISEDMRLWLYRELKRLKEDERLGAQLKPHVEKLMKSLEDRNAWSLIVKIGKENIATFAQERLFENGQISLGEPETVAKTICIVLKDKFETQLPDNQHIRIVFEPVQQ